MRLLTIASIFIVATVAGAQDNPKTPPEKLLYNYLLKECDKHFDARKNEVAALKTPELIKARQQKLKAKFIAALGGFPKKTPLKPQVTGKLDRDDYRIEKVIYESQPNHHVTAILYLPKKGKAPYPGVLLPCGHSANGKAAEAYQRACISLAKNGMAVLCYDPIGQGERLQLLDKNGKAAIPGSTTEHTMVGVGALLVGKSAATYHIWDGIRSLDYLASRPEIDPKRLGCTGNSGGGTLTAYLMALDERIVCAAPSCYLTTLKRLFETIGPQDAEQNITGQVAFGMDHADFVTMRAPLPTLMCVGTQDYFDIDGAWASYREAKLIYGTLGAGHKVSLFEYNDKHGFNKPRRQAAVQWLKRWLLKSDEDIVEADFPIFTDAELQCTRTGQVLSDFNGKSVFDMNAELAKELKKGREKWQASVNQEQVKDKIFELRGNPVVPFVVPYRQLSVAKRNGYSIHNGEMNNIHSGLPIFVTWLVPDKQTDKSSVCIYVHAKGTADCTRPGGPVEKLALAGKEVLAIDTRGFGITSPKKAQGGMAKFFGVEWQEAFLSLHLNKPLLGQRTQDLGAVIEFFCGTNAAVSFKKEKIELIGTGTAAPVVLHLVSPHISKVTIENCVTSWENVVQTPISVNQFSNVVPGALAYYDLPDLAALLAPRPLTIRGALDAAGNPVSQAQMEKVYQKARVAYEKAGAAKNLVLEAAK